MDAQKAILIQEFIKKGVVKFGNFTLKSGAESNTYFDFRILLTFPEILDKTADAMWNVVCEHFNNKEFNAICGVPYGSIPLATYISVKNKVPLLLRRKELKIHGTGQLVEGSYDSNTMCLIVEDVVTTGSSVIETVKVLKSLGISTPIVVSILDRQEGGMENLIKNGLIFISLFKKETFVSLASVTVEGLSCSVVNCSLHETCAKPLSLKERLVNINHPTLKKLINIMIRKTTNLCVSVDVTDFETILKISEAVSPHVCSIKIHVDIIDNFSHEYLLKLIQLSEKNDFLIFSDRKFADIGKTVSSQFHEGFAKISSFSDIVTAHIISGESVIQGLKTHPKGQDFKCHACLLIAQLSCNGNLLTENHQEAAYEIALKHPDFVIGFVCQKRISHSGNFFHFIPGVSIESHCDSLGQRYITPEEAINRGADVIIVGRSICNASDPCAVAEKYKQAISSKYKF